MPPTYQVQIQGSSILLQKISKIQNLQKDKKQGENLYYMCCLLEENGPPFGLLLNYSKAAEDFDLIILETKSHKMCRVFSCIRSLQKSLLLHMQSSLKLEWKLFK